jgi:hypothetical protein
MRLIRRGMYMKGKKRVAAVAVAAVCAVACVVGKKFIFKA